MIAINRNFPPLILNFHTLCTAVYRNAKVNSDTNSKTDMDNLFVLAGPLTMSTMHNELKLGKN